MSLAARILAVIVALGGVFGLAAQAITIVQFASRQVFETMFAGPQGLAFAVSWGFGVVFNVAGIVLSWLVFQLTAERRT